MKNSYVALYEVMPSPMKDLWVRRLWSADGKLSLRLTPDRIKWADEVGLDFTTEEKLFGDLTGQIAQMSDLQLACLVA